MPSYVDIFWAVFRFFYIAVLVGLLVFIAFDIGSDVKRLTSLAGMVIFLTIGFAMSTNPSKVILRISTEEIIKT